MRICKNIFLYQKNIMKIITIWYTVVGISGSGVCGFVVRVVGVWGCRQSIIWKSKKIIVWGHVVSSQEAATAWNRETFLSFSLFILIWCLPFHEIHKHFMFGSMLCQLMEQLRPWTGNPLEFFCFLLFIYNLTKWGSVEILFYAKKI